MEPWAESSCSRWSSASLTEHEACFWAFCRKAWAFGGLRCHTPGTLVLVHFLTSISILDPGQFPASLPTCPSTLLSVCVLVSELLVEVHSSLSHFKILKLTEICEMYVYIYISICIYMYKSIYISVYMYIFHFQYQLSFFFFFIFLLFISIFPICSDRFNLICRYHYHPNIAINNLITYIICLEI